MTKRKTISVAYLRDWVNERLTSDHLTPEHKRGLANALDQVLLKTGNYNGFGYIYCDDERPCLPGKVGADSYNPNWTEYHETRRFYY